ncbi:MAG: 4-alpha-glucanotransferase [Clostridia bacterium]|nr:4-alpha-glucanotransferase [Clostridia bacterium]
MKVIIKTKKSRNMGVLMPVFSLPSAQGIGTLGKGAYAFVDWLESAGMKIWQVLPLLPTSYGDSPYQSASSDALNPYFIDFELLEKDGLLERADYADVKWSYDERRVDYGTQFHCNIVVLKKAFARFDRTKADWLAFLKKGKYADYALFMSLKTKFGFRPWVEWDEPYKSCEGKGLEEYIAAHREEIEFWQFTQYIFLKQWNALHAYAKEKDIQIMGDMPIYVAADSVETWKYRRDMFMLDGEGNLALKAGVPPDAFSEDGQLWGNPVYDWAKMKADGYTWWKKRMDYAFELFDIVRIDHFRAFDRFFAIPQASTTAKDGEWLDGPGMDLFEKLGKRPIIAEDLGVIDDGVRTLLKDTGYPGMKVLLFAFDGDKENDYLPSNILKSNCVAYTGTHDNEPVRAFLENMEEPARKEFETVLEEECLAADVPYITETVEDECKTMIELLASTKANTVIVPMHDVLGLGAEARLNAPSTVSGGNWTFRFTEEDFKRGKAAWLKKVTETYDR